MEGSMKHSGQAVFVAVAALSLAACEAQVGKDEPRRGEAAAGEQVEIEGTAEDGQFSIDLPGFAMKIDLPASIQDKARMDGDGVIYPGSRFRGIHIEARDRPAGQSDGGAEIRFVSDDPLPQLVEWYRDPARAGEINVASAGEADGGYRIEGTQKDGDRFVLRLSSRGGGTEGRLAIQDAN
jgi:hypothetical protein